MWEHAAPLIGVPGAIKALLDLFDRAMGAESSRLGKEQTQQIRDALEAFAVDAIELKAFKSLHSATNQFMIDLGETFTLVSPDEAKARDHHTESLYAIKLEISSLWSGQRAGNQLAELFENPKQMEFLQEMPSSVQQFVLEPPWNEYFWKSLQRARDEAENFKNFYGCIRNIRELNMALNAYADRQIKRGIEDFDRIMDQLRRNLEDE